MVELQRRLTDVSTAQKTGKALMLSVPTKILHVRMPLTTKAFLNIVYAKRAVVEEASHWLPTPSFPSDFFCTRIVSAATHTQFSQGNRSSTSSTP